MRIPTLTLAAAVLAPISPASAQSAPDLADLVGARAAGAATQLEARGYAFITTNAVRDVKWSFWWNARTRQCVQVATSDGRYVTIQRVPEGNCSPAALAGPDRSTPFGEPGPARPPRPDYDNGPGHGDSYGPSLTLICYGAGSGPAMQYQSGYVYNSRSHRFEPQFGTTLGREGFSSDVQIEIWHGRGRIHLGGKLVAPLHSGGDNGWWDVDNLVVTPDRITGQYRMNGLNKPHFEIDRRSQRITIRAATSFSGRCDAGNWRGGAGF